MKAWPSGFAVKRAGSVRGIGNVLRRSVSHAQAIRSRSRRGDAHPRVQARADQGQGVDPVGARAAAITASLPPS